VVGAVNLSFRLDPTRHAPTDARLALDRLEGELQPALLDDLRLVVSELVTNAVVHGPRREPIELKLVVEGPDRIFGEVTDQGEGVIEIRESADEGGGWGLRLLDSVSERWGVHEGSTHVWFELRAR
jgi:anti-sigma regulatory factor (Ser/Thr protein kinase)